MKDQLIPRSPQNAKIFVFHDPEIVRNLTTEGFPIVRDGFAKEF